MISEVTRFQVLCILCAREVGKVHTVCLLVLPRKCPSYGGSVFRTDPSQEGIFLQSTLKLDTEKTQMRCRRMLIPQ